MKKYFLDYFLVFAIGFCLPAQSLALIVFGESNQDAAVSYDASSNAAECSVVSVGTTSAVYLGNGWFVTAKHTNVSLASIVTQNGQSAQVSLVDNSLNSNYGADLSLFYVQDYANLTSLSSVNLSASVYNELSPLNYSIGYSGTPGNYTFWLDGYDASSFLMVGAGRGRSSSSALSDTIVYHDSTPGTVRSGSASYFTPYSEDGFDYFVTMAENAVGAAQAQSGDSGGGLFFEYEDEYYLLGILCAIDATPFSYSYAKFGNYLDATIVYSAEGIPEGIDITNLQSYYRTYSLSLSNYIEDINDIISTNPFVIPEPSTYAVLLAGLSLIFVLLRKKFFSL